MKDQHHLVSVRTIIFASLLIAGNTVQGSAWFTNKLDPSKTAEVEITTVKWGAPDDHARNTEDRLVLQVAAKNYREVTLIFESKPIKGNKYSLRVTTGVHLYRYSGGPYSYCTLCHDFEYYSSYRADGGTCYSDMYFPSKTGLNSFTLVDVQANNTSVPYSIKSSSTTEISRNAVRISLPQKSQFHATNCQLTTLNEAAARPAPTPAPSAAPEETVLVSELVFTHPIGKAFEKLALELVQKYQASLQQFGESYLAALDKLEKRVLGAADLNGAVAIKTERARFQSTRQVPDDAFSDNAAVKSLQLSYQQGEAKIKKHISDSLQTLSASYVEKLKPIQDNFTKSGKIDDALIIQKEITCIKAAPKSLLEPIAETVPVPETSASLENPESSAEPQTASPR